MFFQSPPTPPSGGGGSDRDLKAMEDRIVRAIESGFSKVKLEQKQKTETGDTGYARRGRTEINADINLFSPESYKQGIKQVIDSNLDIIRSPLDTLNKELNLLQKGTKDVFSQFGRGRELSSGIAQAIGDARFSIMEMGGDADEAFRILSEVFDTTNKTTLAGSKYVDDLFATTNVTGQSVKELVGSFDKVGMSLYHISGTMKDVIDYSASVGLNVKEVSDTLLKNFDKLNLYTFQGGVQGLTRMAAQATMLKMDMGKTLALADELLSPEKAMDMAAGLQRLGVSTSALIDPLRLMDMAQNDPEQLQNEIVNLTKQYTYFNEETKKTEILPGAQRYLRELAPMLGLTKEELANMAIQSGTIERKLSEIKMPGFVQKEEDKMLIANLAELNKEGKYEITYLDKNAQEQKVALENLTDAQLEAIKESQKITDADPKTIALKQLTAAEQTNLLLESLGAKLPKEFGATRTGYELGETASAGARTFVRGTYEAGRETLGLSSENIKEIDNQLLEIANSFMETGGEVADLMDKIESKFKQIIEGTGQIDVESIDYNKILGNIETGFAQAGSKAVQKFEEAANVELQGTSSVFAKTMIEYFVKELKEQRGKLSILIGESGSPTTETKQTIGSLNTTPTNQGIETGALDEESGPENNTPINNTNTNNLKGEDVVVNNINNISLLEKDNVAIGRDGMMAGTDLMGLKDRFGDMSTELSKSLLGGVEELKSGFRSILETSPTLLSRQTETGIEPKLLSDNLNITLNPELAPEFAKIYKEVRDMGQSIPLNFSFEEPKFDFKFNTDENIDSYLDFKKNIESQIIKPNVPTEEHKLKFSADKVEGLDQINEKIDGIKNTKLDIPFEITDKSKDEPITRKVETSLDDNSINEMVKDLFSEKRMNVGFNFENKEDFEKLSKEFEDLTKEKKIKVSQDEFKSNIPTEQTLKVIPEQDEFKSNVPEEQTSHLKLQFNREETDNIFKEVGDKFKDPLKLTFEQDKFESTIPIEQTLKVKPEEEKFESKIPQEQSFKLNYEFSNKTDFDNVIKELDQTKETHKIKFEQEKFESSIPSSQTIKVDTEQEEFKSIIPEEQTFKLDYDFTNKTDFEKLSKEFEELTKDKKVKVTQEEFKPNIPEEQTLKIIPKQEEFKSNIPEDQTFKLNYDFINKSDFDKVIGELDKTKETHKIKFEQENFQSNIPEEQKLKLSFDLTNQNETETLINKMSSDKEFKLFTDESSLTKESEKISSIFDNEIKLNPKIDENSLKDVSLPKIEQEVSLKQPEDSEMDSLRQKFESSTENLKSSFEIPTSLVDNLNLMSGLNRNEYLNTNLQGGTNLLQNENTNNLTAQSTSDTLMRMLTERFASPNNTITPTVQPVSTPREMIPTTNNLGTNVNSTKMEFGELKIVHEIKVSSGNVDPSVVGQAFTQLTRDPSFVKTLETKIKDLQGGMGQQVQMNPLTA